MKVNGKVGQKDSGDKEQWRKWTGKRNLELSTSDSKAGAAPISSGTSLPQAVSNIFHLPCCQSHRYADKKKKKDYCRYFTSRQPVLLSRGYQARDILIEGQGRSNLYTRASPELCFMYIPPKVTFNTSLNKRTLNSCLTRLLRSSDQTLPPLPPSPSNPSFFLFLFFFF